jgi:hypothetical protein
MAGLIFLAQNTENALVAATAEHVLQVRAAANHPIKVLGWGIFFDGVSVVGEPVQVRLTGATTTGTFDNALTITGAYGSKICINGRSETIQATAHAICSAEPTPVQVFDVAEVHPQSGYEVRYPLGQEPIIAGGNWVGVECTAPAIVNARAKLIIEE